MKKTCLVIFLCILSQAMLSWTIVCSPSDGGTIGTISDGEGKRYYIATPSVGYTFDKWVVINVDKVVNTTTNASLYIDGYMGGEMMGYGIYTLTAYFTQAPQCTITTSAQNGTVTGGGTYEYNAIATLTAMPNEHYHFVGWSDGNTSNPRTLTVTKDSTFTAVFALDQFTITATGEHGSIAGSGTYNYGATVILTATPNEGYHFAQWTDGNTDNPRQVVATQDSTFTAEFAKQIDSTQIIDVAVYGDCSKNGYNKDFTHIAVVNSNSGRTSCEWVQLWENGPKWATFNVGATITDYANLTIGEDPISFSGYTKQAPYYNTANVGGLYPWNNPNINGRTTTWKSTTGIADVATTIWGNNWETPTSKQLDTLLVDITYGKTTWTWCDGNTVQYVAGCVLKGYKVSGVGDYAQFSIFLPAAGYYDKSSGKIAYASSYGKYWSGTVSYYDFLYFYTGYHVRASNRENGNSVRAVLADNTVPTDNVTLTLKTNDCETYNVITCIKEQPLRITATDSECSKFVRWSDGNTENPRVVSINGNCAYTAIFEKINYTITLDADEEKGKVVEEK